MLENEAQNNLSINNNSFNLNLFQNYNTLQISVLRDSNINKSIIKDKINYKNIKKKDKIIIIILLKIIIFINMINLNISENIKNNNRNLEKQNIIYLTIFGNGTLNIIDIDWETDYYPDLIYINDKKSEYSIESSNIYVESEKKINKIKFIWNIKLDTLYCLFFNVSSILSVDLSEFDTSLVTDMKSMFYNCINLKNVNFGNINTSSVIDMAYMFNYCKELTSINLTNFDISKVTNMESMFLYMPKLKELDFSEKNASSLKKINKLFMYCDSLTSLKLNLLNSSKLQRIDSLFENCISLKFLNLKLDTSSVTNMEGDFYGCSSLTSLDVSFFNTSNVENMIYMFGEARSLEYLNVSGFNIHNTIDMNMMFYNCKALKSLDLSDFDFNQASLSRFFYGCTSLTSIKFSKEYKLVSSASFLFCDCYSLLSIDLFNFDFGIIEDMESLFYGCTSLTSIDLSYIDTFSVTNMESLFHGCNSLEKLDFDGWITSSVKSIRLMFHGCTSLISLDLSNFDTSNVESMAETFNNCIKLKSINLQNFDTSNVLYMQSMFSGCTSLVSLDLSSFDTSNVNNMESMFYNCNKLISLDLSNFSFEAVVSMNSMFFLCKSLAYINLKNFYYYEEEIQINYLFYGIKDNLVLCIDENIFDLEGFRVPSNLNNLICPINDCSDDWIDKKNRLIYQNNTCINNCQDDEIYKYEYDYICYSECPKGTHNSDNNNYLCEKNINKCLKKYKFTNIEDNSCADNCRSEDFFNKKCGLNIKNKETEKLLINKIIMEAEKGQMNKIINEIINENEDKIIIDNGITYQLTSSLNQKKISDKNISYFNLGKCESILKEKYHISNEENLIIFKIEQKVEGFSIPLIEYEIFNEKTKEKLNLDCCGNKYIDIFIPVNINENLLYKYQPDSSYYNDICTVDTTEFGTDITLYDRKNEYNSNNLSLCQINCKFINYDFDNKIVACQCKAKNGITLNEDILLNKLKNSKIYLNLNVLKCVKLVFTKKGLFKNMGNYIILPIIILHLISIIYFYLKGFNLINNQIQALIIIKKDYFNSKNYYLDNNQFKENFNDIISSPKKKKKKKIPTIKLTSDLYLSKDNLSNNNKNNETIQSENFINYSNYEMNVISYEEALKNDKRTFLQFYLSLLKENHILIFSFNPNKDYNPFIIKICLFFLIISLIFFINTLFFNDSAMHQIYIDKGIFNFSYFFPQIIYSVIICSIIYAILRKAYLTKKDILKIKYENNKDLLNARIINTLKCLNIKFICFFVINIIFLLIFWLYLSSFCIVYLNTQLYLFKVLLINFSIYLVFPFFIYLIPTSFRILSLNESEKCFYNISKFIQFL